MNEQALIKYISNTLHTFVRKFDKNQRMISAFCGRSDLIRLQPNEKSLYPLLFENVCASRHSLPHLFLVNNLAIYTLITVPDGYFLVGPTCFSYLPSLIEQFFIEDFSDDLKSILTLSDYSEYAKTILLIQNLYQDYETTEEMLWNVNLQDNNASIQRTFQNAIFKGSEEGITHNSYEQELREQSSIEHGDIVQLRKSLSEDYGGSLGTLSPNELRNIKNLGIVVITLASRSAIRGGLLPESSFSLSDAYIRTIEESQDALTVQNLTRKAEFQYAKLVHELQEKKKGSSSKENPSDCRQSGARTVVLAPFFSVCSNCSPKMIKKSILSSLSYRFFEASLLVFLDSCRQR